jgi:hypothetical protein
MKTQPYPLALVLLGLASSPATFAESKEAVPPEKSASQVEPSGAFRAYVQSMEITGVFVGHGSGAQNRAVVNKRLVRPGDVIESELGVRFVSVDADAKILVFEDKTGARLTKSYGQGN